MAKKKSAGSNLQKEIEALEEKVEQLLDERDELEGKCDTLPQCEKDDGCETCEVYKKIAEYDEKIEKLEEQIESIQSELDDFD